MVQKKTVSVLKQILFFPIRLLKLALQILNFLAHALVFLLLAGTLNVLLSDKRGEDWPYAILFFLCAVGITTVCDWIKNIPKSLKEISRAIKAERSIRTKEKNLSNN